MPPMRTPLSGHAIRSLAVALLAATSSACAIGEEAPSRASWGGIVEEAPEPTKPLEGPLSIPTPSVPPAPTREFSADEKAFFDLAWKAFRRGDPSWPVMKAEWMDRGPEAKGLLAENLYRALVASRVKGALHLVDEAKKDLVLMGKDAVPILVGGLAVRAVKRADGAELRVGQEVLHDAAEALSLIGAPSVPGLLDVARGGEQNQVVEALGALGNIGPTGDDVAEAVILDLSESEDWQVRAAAVLALRKFPTDAARTGMVKALEDTDPLVVERAAQALATGRHRGVALDVVDALDRAMRDARIGTARACVFVLRSLTGETIGEDAAAWRARLGAR